ncbi:MAG: PilZ domain-containing protein [Acidobacteria bacterium]|nr:PilZ domain-containing protein [Acidobacteriota bacterium]
MSNHAKDVIHGDRRADRRYELDLAVRFTCQEWGARTGLGHTLELSRGGIRYWTETPPPVGATVELRIHWPFLLQNVCPLELDVRGTVLRVDQRGTVVKVSKYEFRTAGERSFEEMDGSKILSFVA